MHSALYFGTVTHVRQRPKTHRLAYRVANLMVDLDEWDAIGKVSRLLGIDRPGLMSLKRSDYLDTSDRPLKESVRDLLAAQGIHDPLGRVRLFTYPRMFGYLFNPVSVYLCETTHGDALATIYEVNNTFGERHRDGFSDWCGLCNHGPP